MLTNKDIIYQVFVRNYSKEGKSKSLFKDLNRIKSLETIVLYLLPIHSKRIPLIGLIRMNSVFDFWMNLVR